MSEPRTDWTRDEIVALFDLPLTDVAAPGQDAVTLPLKEGSLRFAVVGDTGAGKTNLS